MFRLVQHQDCVEVKPSEFDKNLDELFIKKLNDKYINKIIDGVGLVLCVSEIIKYGQGTILRTVGSAIFKIEFKIAIFAPFKGQIIRGTISKSDSNGLEVSLEFYKGILVPVSHMNKSYTYDSKSETWTSNEYKHAYAVGSEINVQVLDIAYNYNMNMNSDGSNPAENELDGVKPMIILAKGLD